MPILLRSTRFSTTRRTHGLNSKVRGLCSKFVTPVAVVAAHCVRVRRGTSELLPVPFCAVVVSTTGPCAVTPGDYLSKMLVAAAAEFSHGAGIAALVHVLHREDSEKS
jgi:hypothetical protein